MQVTQHRPSTPQLPSPEELSGLLDRWSAGDRLAIAAALAEAHQRGLRPDGTREAMLIGPQTDEELLDAVEELTGHRIPRNAVCIEHGHTSPAQTFCDLYFERVWNVLWIGNRGGGKTANSGHLHGAKNRWLPGYSSAIAGAVEKQGYRAYAEFRKFTRSLGSEIISSLLSKTVWANGSETEVLGGTVRQLNGPHPNLAQMDEAELTTTEPFEEFLNMAQGNERYNGQQLLTSTRKKAFGLVQGIVKEVMDAKKMGAEPPWEIRIFCVFETMARVPHCRSAPKDEREALLKSLGRNPKELCNCHNIKKGTWEDGRERRFDQVCHGRAFRADGFVQLSDVTKRFTQLSKMTWEAQQECLTPEQEGVVHKWMTERYHLLTWVPHAFFGPIYRGWDWGGQNPHAVVWCQMLRVPVGLNADGLPVLEDEDEEIMHLLPEGTLVQFDEIYKTSDELPGDGGFSDLATVVANREKEWREYGFEMEIAMDACDPSGFVAKREVKKRYRELIAAGTHPGLEPIKFTSVPAPVYETVLLHQSWGEGGRVRVSVPMCPRTLDEYDTYHWPERKDGKNLSENPVDEDNHAMDAKRYIIWNLERKLDRDSSASEIPGSVERGQEKQPRGPQAGPFAKIPVAPSNTAIPESPVGSSPRGTGTRMRERPVPSVRQVAGPGFRR